MAEYLDEGFLQYVFSIFVRYNHATDVPIHGTLKLLNQHPETPFRIYPASFAYQIFTHLRLSLVFV
jgi:hypothetical protein